MSIYSKKEVQINVFQKYCVATTYV